MSRVRILARKSSNRRRIRLRRGLQNSQNRVTKGLHNNPIPKLQAPVRPQPEPMSKAADPGSVPFIGHTLELEEIAHPHLVEHASGKVVTFGLDENSNFVVDEATNPALSRAEKAIRGLVNPVAVFEHAGEGGQGADLLVDAAGSVVEEVLGCRDKAAGRDIYVDNSVRYIVGDVLGNVAIDTVRIIAVGDGVAHVERGSSVGRMALAVLDIDSKRHITGHL